MNRLRGRPCTWPPAEPVAVIGESVAGADVDHGPPLDAMLAVGQRLVFLFDDPRALEEYGSPDASGPLRGAYPGGDENDDPTIALIRRGQADGTLGDGVNATWIRLRRQQERDG